MSKTIAQQFLDGEDRALMGAYGSDFIDVLIALRDRIYYLERQLDREADYRREQNERAVG